MSHYPVRVRAQNLANSKILLDLDIEGGCCIDGEFLFFKIESNTGHKPHSTQVAYCSRIPKSNHTLRHYIATIFLEIKKKKELRDEYEGAPSPADEERGNVHLEVGAGADQQQHHRHKRVEVEQRRVHPPTMPPPLSGMKVRSRTNKSTRE